MDEIWLSRAANAYSYRRIYGLASDLLEEDDLPYAIRCQASWLCNMLQPVIDQAIAPAALLGDAQRSFRQLKALLKVAYETGRGVHSCRTRMAPPGRNVRASERMPGTDHGATG